MKLSKGNSAELHNWLGVEDGTIVTIDEIESFDDNVGLHHNIYFNINDKQGDVINCFDEEVKFYFKNIKE